MWIGRRKIRRPLNGKKEVRPVLTGLSDIRCQLTPISRTAILLSRTKLTPDISRPVRAVSVTIRLSVRLQRRRGEPKARPSLAGQKPALHSALRTDTVPPHSPATFSAGRRRSSVLYLRRDRSDGWSGNCRPGPRCTRCPGCPDGCPGFLRPER